MRRRGHYSTRKWSSLKSHCKRRLTENEAISLNFIPSEVNLLVNSRQLARSMRQRSKCFRVIWRRREKGSVRLKA